MDGPGLKCMHMSLCSVQRWVLIYLERIDYEKVSQRSQREVFMIGWSAYLVTPSTVAVRTSSSFSSSSFFCSFSSPTLGDYQCNNSFTYNCAAPFAYWLTDSKSVIIIIIIINSFII